MSIADRHVVIDRDLCNGCSLCSHVCPESAIVMLPGA
ncbi:4Fe-4S binding protein [Methanoculleus sp.]